MGVRFQSRLFSSMWWPGLVGLVALTLFGVALAGSGHSLGWSVGTPAAGTASVGPVDLSTASVIRLPKALAKQVRKRTLLFYFAPDCSHCRDVAPEIAALTAELDEDARVLAVATARSTEEEVLEYLETFGLEVTWTIDTSAEVSAALGARSTPVLVLMERHKGQVVELDRWAPYTPGTDTLVKMRLLPSPWPVLAEGGYLGNQVCGECHTEEIRSWNLSHHSAAWRNLVLSGGSRDPACTDCHVTGAKEPGGWQGIGDRSMVDVGCEACHGAAGPHDGVSTRASDTCESCHDQEHSIDFTYEKGAPHIDHYVANVLDETAFEEARSALLGGEAPKPLLAFGEGPNVGSTTCLECHSESHAWWEASAHGQAMETLHEAKRHEDLACVRCHATPMTTGAAPQELAGYRVEEGVGCESCHGPGNDHVEAGGGLDNIVGLGASCPVCVIESICTSCHTPKWDKDWELEAELARVAHVPPVSPEAEVATETMGTSSEAEKDK